jgi:hypothetical protein
MAGTGFTFADAGQGITTGNQLYRFYGDANNDRSVTAGDFNVFRGFLGTTDITFDSNLDGVVTAGDFNAFRAKLGLSI